MGFGSRGGGFVQPPTDKYHPIKTIALVVHVPTIAMISAENHSGGAFTNSEALTIPVSTLAIVAAEDHSGGAFTDDEAMTVPVPTLAVVAEIV